MRILALAVCGVLLTVSLAVAAPADRAALLERLRLAMPPIGAGESMGERLTGRATEELTARNPGREADIRRIAEAFGACGDKVMSVSDAEAIVLRAVDKGMTEEEILYIVKFYEGPEARELAVLTKKVTSGQPDAETVRRMTALMSHPAFEKFIAVMTTEVKAFTERKEFGDGVVACHQQYRADAEKAGLKLD